jgi:anti-anti-sigma factor
MGVRTCKHCNARVPAIARFCPYCGEELEQTEGEAQQKGFAFKKEIYKSQQGKVGVVRLSGAIEAKDARILRSLFDELEQDNAHRVIFCMKDVTYISSAALGLLVSFASDKKLAKGTHSVFLADVSQAVGNAMSVLGILPFFALFPDLKSAIAALGIEPEKEKEGGS